MQAADVIVDPGISERQLGGLAFQRDRRALCLGASDRYLVRRGIGVGPGDGLALADDDRLRPELEVGDRDHARAGRGLDHGAFRRALQARQRDHEILAGVRLVAGEAGRQIGLLVDLLVRAERLVLPFAVANVVLVLGAPAVALLHDRVGDEIALLEAAVGTLDRLAGRVELRLVLHQHQHRTARDRLALAHGFDRSRRRVELAILLVVVAVDRGVKRAFLETLRERDLVAAGKRRIADQRPRRRSERDSDNQSDVFHDFPLVLRTIQSVTRPRGAGFNPGDANLSRAMAQTKTPPFATLWDPPLTCQSSRLV